MSKSAATRLLNLSQILSGMGSYVTTQMLHAFCTIAHYNEAEGLGMNMTELDRRVGLTSSTRTRTVQALSHKRGRKEDDPTDGLGLVETAVDPEDPRAKLVFLTPKGRRVWGMMKKAMED